jgi:hypothetical protein
VGGGGRTRRVGVGGSSGGTTATMRVGGARSGRP